MQSTDTNTSHVSTKESNVIVVCIGNSFKTKCLTSTNATSITPTLPLSINNPSSSPTVVLTTPFNNSNNNKIMTNSKFQNLVGNNEDFSRINCQINKVLEEEDEEEEKEDIMFENSKCGLMPSVMLHDEGSSEATTEPTQINVLHLSNDQHSFYDDNVNDNSRNLQKKSLLILNKPSTLKPNQQQPNKLIKCRNDFKTETCI